jgi:hypothetical protein
MIKFVTFEKRKRISRQISEEMNWTELNLPPSGQMKAFIGL